MRISVTDIDQFHWFLNHEDMPLEDLLSRLRREGEETEAMRAGSALHHALEFSTAGNHSVLQANGYTFHMEIDGELDMPEFREIKAEKVYNVNGIPVELVGMVDALHGTRVDDHKTTKRFDAERFFDGYQWRFYLDMFRANQFRWNVFEMREDKKHERTYIVHGFHQPSQWRYPGLEADCQRELSRFVDFVCEHMPEKVAA